jgi:hypothetical protein
VLPAPIFWRPALVSSKHGQRGQSCCKATAVGGCYGSSSEKREHNLPAMSCLGSPVAPVSMAGTAPPGPFSLGRAGFESFKSDPARIDSRQPGEHFDRRIISLDFIPVGDQPRHAEFLQDHSHLTLPFR